MNNLQHAADNARAKRQLDAARWRLLRGHGRALGIAGASGHAERSHRTRGQWRFEPVPLPLGTFVAAMFDSRTRASVYGARELAVIVIDIDAHEHAGAGMDVDTYLNPRTRAATVRQRVATACRPVIAALRELYPWPWQVESSPRGLHATVKTSERMPVHELEAVATTIAHDLEGVADASGVKVEGFPSLDGKGTGRTCALPLSGSARLLADDLCTPIGRTRVEGLQRFVSAPCLSIADLRASKTYEKIEANHANDGVIIGERRTAAQRRPKASRPAVKARGGEAASARAQSARTDGKLEGVAFLRRVAELCNRIDPGESWEAARRLAYFATRSLGLDEGGAVDLFGKVIDRPHGAAHCQDAPGCRDLLRTFRTCVRRYLRTKSGRTKPVDERVLRIVEAVERGGAIDVEAMFGPASYETARDRAQARQVDIAAKRRTAALKRWHPAEAQHTAVAIDVMDELAATAKVNTAARARDVAATTFPQHDDHEAIDAIQATTEATKAKRSRARANGGDHRLASGS